MWSIVTVRLPDGHVHGVRLRGSSDEAIAEVVQEARDNGAVKSTGEADAVGLERQTELFRELK